MDLLPFPGSYFWFPDRQFVIIIIIIIIEADPLFYSELLDGIAWFPDFATGIDEHTVCVPLMYAHYTLQVMIGLPNWREIQGDCILNFHATDFFNY